jgi:predicted alpha-1,2-mannosidase
MVGFNFKITFNFLELSMIMGMKKLAIALLGSFICFTASGQSVLVDKVTDPVEWVNPLMGTDSKHSLSNGNTYPAIALPWGMNFWMPQTGKMGDGWGYMYSADKIRGFKQTHQPSPWMNDYGQFAIMPVTGKLRFDQDSRASWFSHKAETVKPYYYSVYLADHDVTTEITPTERAASFRFTFPQTDSAYVVIDAFDKGSYVKVIPGENKIVGYTTKNSGGVPENFKNYFVIVFDKPFAYTHTWQDSVLSNKLELQANHVGAVIGFKTKKGEQVNARVASSFISPEQAELNLKEIGNDSFDAVKEKGKQAWNNELSRIAVEGGTPEQMRTFYSCLYRTLLFPRKFYEIDAAGKVMHYSPYNGKVLPGFMYTDTGFWDTFRALFPFLNLMYPSVNAEIQEGLANTYKEGGWLPEWASPGYRNVMVGNNSASVVADAYLKGIRGQDIKALYEGVLKGANNEGPLTAVGRAGAAHYNKLGYVPYDVKINENAARTLEYAYDDFAIYQLAKALKRPKKEINLYAKRALNYRNLYDPATGLMRGKNQNGAFQSPFNPFKWGDAFTEGNSWHYSWSVFHDVQGLIDLMGGNANFTAKLDSVFTLPPVYDESYYGFVIHEIREMQIANMGQYAHGNQPIQHMIYLYNYAGEPWKAQHWVRETMNRMYTPAPDGYCGDEDNGQTSAWYVFSALGFYPVTPATDQYVIGAPLFKKATLQLENGKQLVINAPQNSSENRYINSARFNGKDYGKNWLSHSELQKGATIDFDMAAEPNKQRGTKADAFPYSLSNDNKIKL